MTRVFPLALLLVCACASAQPDPSRTVPLRDAHIVTVTQERGQYLFEVEGQPYDLAAALNPGGTLVVAATDGLRVMVVAEDRGVYDTRNHTGHALMAGPVAVWIDGRDHDEVGVLRATSELRRGLRGEVRVSFLVCDREVGYGDCDRWVAARPRIRPSESGTEDRSLRLEVDGGPHVYAPANRPAPAPEPGPPVRPVRE
ncbi:hypothetical protein [Rubrivirga sp. IMCC45206]|uniref:hypothetical protein n=1 Tax=Rubrivirga sp. IMCC45206 TaxID=3391614 RepID=UPI00399035F4